MEEVPTDDKRAPDVISADLRYGSMQRGDINLAIRTPENLFADAEFDAPEPRPLSHR